MRKNEWIRARLQLLGKTQRELAKALSTAASRVNEIIDGTRKVSASEVMNIADCLEMPEIAVLEHLTGRRAQRSTLKMRLEGYVGAGEEVMPIDMDAPIEWVDAPNGMQEGSAVAVRGESMAPALHTGDILILGERNDPAGLVGRDCVVRLATGQAYVKRLTKGSRKGRFHLLSHNRSDVLSDRRLDWAAPILWVKKAILLIAALLATAPAFAQSAASQRALQEMETIALGPYRQWQEERPTRCSSPTLAKAADMVRMAASVTTPEKGGMDGVFAAANWLLVVADGARQHHCVVASRALYDTVLSTYVGGAYASFRERARVGIDDLRSVKAAP